MFEEKTEPYFMGMFEPRNTPPPVYAPVKNTLSVKRIRYLSLLQSDRSLKSAASQLIIIIWTEILYNSPHEAHLKNQRIAFVKKDKYPEKSQRVIFQKSQKLLAENLHERAPIQNIH